MKDTYSAAEVAMRNSGLWVRLEDHNFVVTQYIRKHAEADDECQLHREAHMRIDNILHDAAALHIAHEGGQKQAWENTIEGVARLRGEAAQGEQQAVRHEYRTHPGDRWYACTERQYRDRDKAIAGDAGEFRALYTRPQPAVAGDAVQRALDAIQFDEHGQQVTVIGEAARSRLEAALSAAPAAPDGAPMEMRICELRHVILWPNRAYVFTVDPNCAKCREVAQTGDYGKPAAPAPVAGDAVAALPRSWRKEAGIQQNHSYARGLDRCAEQLTAALAQDLATRPAIDEDLAFSTWLVQFCSTRTGDGRDSASDMRAAWKARASLGAAAGAPSAPTQEKQ